MLQPSHLELETLLMSTAHAAQAGNGALPASQGLQDFSDITFADVPMAEPLPPPSGDWSSSPSRPSISSPVRFPSPSTLSSPQHPSGGPSHPSEAFGGRGPAAHSAWHPASGAAPAAPTGQQHTRPALSSASTVSRAGSPSRSSSPHPSYSPLQQQVGLRPPGAAVTVSAPG